MLYQRNRLLKTIYNLIGRRHCGIKREIRTYYQLWESRPYISEKAMAPHSSTLPWKIPWTEEPCGLQSMGSRRVGHDWVTSLSLFTFTHWRRKWQPTPMFLPGECQGWWSLVGCSLWGRTESDTTDATKQQQHFLFHLFNSIPLLLMFLALMHSFFISYGNSKFIYCQSIFQFYNITNIFKFIF